MLTVGSRRLLSERAELKVDRILELLKRARPSEQPKTNEQPKQTNKREQDKGKMGEWPKTNADVVMYRRLPRLPPAPPRLPSIVFVPPGFVRLPANPPTELGMCIIQPIEYNKQVN